MTNRPEADIAALFNLGMHNILWHEVGDGQPAELSISGLIDLDHAALGDPAIDVAPLLGQFGSAALAGAPTGTSGRRVIPRQGSFHGSIAPPGPSGPSKSIFAS